MEKINRTDVNTLMSYHNPILSHFHHFMSSISERERERERERGEEEEEEEEEGGYLVLI